MAVCLVSGTVRGIDNQPIADAKVWAENDRAFEYGDDIILPQIYETTTDENGDWTLELLESETPGVTYDFGMTYSDTKRDYTRIFHDITVPNAQTADFAELVTITNTPASNNLVKTLRYGDGPPANSLGQNGDFYIDKTNWVMYGPKLAGIWPAGVDFDGSPGSDGPQGPPGPAGQALVNRFTLDQEDIDAKYVVLSEAPIDMEMVRITIAGGLNQVWGVDFIIEGNILSWANHDLDGILAVGDTLIVEF